jgi:hypothetical protein
MEYSAVIAASPDGSAASQFGLPFGTVTTRKKFLSASVTL